MKTEIPENKDTKKYRMVFLTSEDYKLIGKDMKNKISYDALNAIGVENFMMKASGAVFIPDKYRAMMATKARKNEAI